MKNNASISKLGGAMMLFSGFILMLSLLITFPFASAFSIAIQVGGHILTIVSAAIFKVGYIVFAVGRHERGMDF